MFEKNQKLIAFISKIIYDRIKYRRFDLFSFEMLNDEKSFKKLTNYLKYFH